MFLKNRNISSKIKRSKVTDYAALRTYYLVRSIAWQEWHEIYQLSHDLFDLEIVNFPFLDGDVPRSTSYGVDSY